MDLSFNPEGLSLESMRQLFRETQKTVRSVEACVKAKIPDLKKQVKEIRRKIRLRSMYAEYFKSINLSPQGSTNAGQAYRSSEFQLKSLIAHQRSFLSSPQFQPMPTSQTFSSFVYKNPLILKISSLFTIPTKPLQPDLNKLTIKSHYFHEETLVKETKAALLKEVELKVTEFSNEGKIRGLVARRRKIDFEYDACLKNIVKKVKQVYKERKDWRKKEMKMEVKETSKCSEDESAISLSRAITEIEGGCATRKVTFSEKCDDEIEAIRTVRPSMASSLRLGFFSKIY